MLERFLESIAESKKKVETERIKLHLKQTEEVLRNKDVEDCVDERRNETLKDLNHYRKRGKFPINPDFRSRRPYFVGPDGTLCAVGFLLDRADRDDTVEHIEEEDNHVYLESVGANEPINWKKELGLTKAECERIQPSYSPNYALAQTCGPVACRVALGIVLLISSSILLKLEKFCYSYVNRLYPQKPLKRRSAFTGISIINLVLVANLFVLLFAIFP